MVMFQMCWFPKPWALKNKIRNNNNKPVQAFACRGAEVLLDF
ncbi:hypothetical protein SAMN05443429_1261 [Cruoricaptor ignavus]|uniref:Uncharacterized protein n=1 Tax=Cruoricaptor ignavus TaxID=1118202 RepID=A0A1M6HYP2_9FLAO|nr:hypothetical protein SAMN05443429_1261 [Cruoricaptor ignavus]